MLGCLRITLKENANKLREGDNLCACHSRVFYVKMFSICFCVMNEESARYIFGGQKNIKNVYGMGLK